MKNTLQIIQTSNPSQNHQELLHFIESIPSPRKYCLEIGVHMGGTFKTWRDVWNPDLLIGIDTDYPPTQHIPRSDKHVLFVPCSSMDPAVFSQVDKLLNGKLLDFLFIDGDHRYDAVKSDFEMYKKMCGNNAVIGFHDIKIQNHPDCQVNEFWDEIEEEYNTREFWYGDSGIGAIYL